MAKKETKKATAKTTKKTTTAKKKKATVRKTASAKAKATTPKKAEPAPNGSETLERIRARAFEIYQTGRNPSDPVRDWFEAEREVLAEIGSP